MMVVSPINTLPSTEECQGKITQFFTLQDGRQIAYQSVGDPKGRMMGE